MINGLLPLSSLKRDEIYSFIAGIYVSVIWYMYFGSIFKPLHSNGLTLYSACIFITLWLTSTVVIFVILLYLSSIMSSSLQKYCDVTEQDNLLKLLNIGKSRLNHFSQDYLKELLIFTHIVGLAITSSILVLYPILLLLSFSIKYMSLFIVAQSILILLLLYQYHRFWLCNCAFAALRRKGRVEVYDEKKYSEETALALAKVNVEFNKEFDAKGIFDKLLGQVQIIKHEHSALDLGNLSDDCVEWKWHAFVKVENTTNMYNFRKYSHLEYILCDEEGYVLTVSSLSFNDENRVQFYHDKAGLCDDDSVVLTCKTTASIPKAYAKLKLLGYCKLKFTCP